VCLPMHTSNSPQTSQVIYATKCSFLNILSFPPPKLCVCLNFFIHQITARCSRYWATSPSLASKVSPSPLQIRGSQRGISPTKSRDGPPPLPPKTGPLTRFRWWNRMSKTPKMLLRVIRTRGWVFRCVGLLFNKF
jgi:hypothetical protein